MNINLAIRALDIRGFFSFALFWVLAITDVIDIVIISVLLGYDFYKKKNPTPYLVILALLVASAIIRQLRLSTVWQAFAGKWAALFY